MKESELQLDDLAAMLAALLAADTNLRFSQVDIVNVVKRRLIELHRQGIGCRAWMIRYPQTGSVYGPYPSEEQGIAAARSHDAYGYSVSRMKRIGE